LNRRHNNLGRKGQISRYFGHHFAPKGQKMFGTVLGVDCWYKSSRSRCKIGSSSSSTYVVTPGGTSPETAAAAAAAASASAAVTATTDSSIVFMALDDACDMLDAAINAA
jgi:hypothetical protein